MLKTAPPAIVSQPRRVERLVAGQPTSDGAGVKLTRVLTQPLQRRLDPFLMLDAFGSDKPGDYIAGFPDHPHRGFETITYMIAGRMRHRDSAGNEGLLDDGGVQWMTAGRGVIHSELPEQTEGLMEGFQLWLNLYSADKMQPPGYRDIPSAQIPEWHADGVTVRVIAGASHGVAGAVTRPTTEPLVLDITLPPGAEFETEVPAGHNALLYCFAQCVVVGGDAADALDSERMAILANDPAADGVHLRAPADAAGAARVLLVAGRPLKEPIVQYGPFVMNTTEQIHQAVADYQRGVLAA
jgi:redox-sensitive bicupin YhaK (pirin superfamily)